MGKTVAMIWKAPVDWDVCSVGPGIRAVCAPTFPRSALEHIIHVSECNSSQAKQSQWKHKLVKDSKSAVYRISDGVKTYYSKHYTNRAFGEMVKAVLRPPMHSVAVADALAQDHLPVPAPAAALSIRRGWWRRERVFVSCEAPGKLLRYAG